MADDVLLSRLIRLYTRSELEARALALDEAIKTGATTVNVPGLSGTVSLQILKDELVRTETAILAKLGATSADAAAAAASGPRGVGHDFSASPVFY